MGYRTLRRRDYLFRKSLIPLCTGYSRPLVRVSDYLGLLERSTYAGDRMR
jgi:hypothetical protein